MSFRGGGTAGGSARKGPQYVRHIPKFLQKYEHLIERREGQKVVRDMGGGEAEAEGEGEGAEEGGGGGGGMGGVAGSRAEVGGPGAQDDDGESDVRS
ncbi:hypothetical protein CLOM_g13640 [Closterium sp. NIES-68]|nr:hypothetical protein CLOM_g13640 [Closterium sp. NIES-68]